MSYKTHQYLTAIPDQPEAIVMITTMRARTFAGFRFMWAGAMSQPKTVAAAPGCVQVKACIISPRELMMVSYWQNRESLMAFFRSQAHIEWMRYVTLRDDNADQRQTDKGIAIGCVGTQRQAVWEQKKQDLAHARQLMMELKKTPHELAQYGVQVNMDGVRRPVFDLIKMANITWDDLALSGLNCKISIRISSHRSELIPPMPAIPTGRIWILPPSVVTKLCFCRLIWIILKSVVSLPKFVKNYQLPALPLSAQLRVFQGSPPPPSLLSSAL